MATVTTQAAVKAALKAALLARALIVSDHIQVSYGEPGDEGRSEVIFIGTAAVNQDQEPRAFGSPGKRLEDYVLKVHAENSSKPSPEQAEARVIVLIGEVERAVIESPKLGVDGVSFIIPTGMTLRTSETETGNRAIATVNLSVTARLT